MVYKIKILPSAKNDAREIVFKQIKASTKDQNKLDPVYLKSKEWNTL